MILDTGSKIISDPDRSVVGEAVHACLQDGNFAVLSNEAATESFIQAFRDRDDSLRVEYRDDRLDRLFAADSVPVEVAVSMFWSYLEKSDGWRSLVGWRDITQEVPGSKDVYWGLRVTSTPWPSQDSSSSVQVTTTGREGWGVVYLLRAGPFYKIGKTTDVHQRLSQIRLQLPFPTELIHSIETDDIHGIETYWHTRFSDKRTNGEWFLLSDGDVAAFTSGTRM